MSRRDEMAPFGPKVLLLSAFRLRRPSLQGVDRRRTLIRDRRGRQLLRRGSMATRAASELFYKSAQEAEDDTLKQMFELLGQLSLMQTTMIEDKLHGSRKR